MSEKWGSNSWYFLSRQAKNLCGWSTLSPPISISLSSFVPNEFFSSNSSEKVEMTNSAKLLLTKLITMWISFWQVKNRCNVCPFISNRHVLGRFHQPIGANAPAQVISRKKVDQLVVLLFISRFALYAVRSSLKKLSFGVRHCNLPYTQEPFLRKHAQTIFA